MAIKKNDSRVKPGFNKQGKIDLADYDGMRPKEFQDAKFQRYSFVDLESVDTEDPNFWNVGIRSGIVSEEERIESFQVSYDNEGWLTTGHFPPCIDTNGDFIGGRGRLRAAKRNGERWVPAAVYSRSDTSLRNNTTNGLRENVRPPSYEAGFDDFVGAGFHLIMNSQLNDTVEDIDSWLYNEVEIEKVFNNNGGRITKLREKIRTKVKSQSSLVFNPTEKGHWKRWIQKNLNLNDSEYVLMNTKDTTRTQRFWMSHLMPAVCDERDPVSIIFYTSEHDPDDARSNMLGRIKELEEFYQMTFKFINSQLPESISINVPVKRPWAVLGAVPQFTQGHDITSNKLVKVEEY
jgi:hypothetical protein|tara:strand:+ start:314 stop:1357 length:1044 start_codon:yes stop_codon:yes gene_type:complete